MRIKCLHGYFIFEEMESGDASLFSSTLGLDLVQKDNYYTFPLLADAGEYSLANKIYLGDAVANVTHQGKPWEVMEENELVYDFTRGTVRRISTITEWADIANAGNYYVSSGLILPGSITDGGLRVKEYTAWLLWDSMQFRYSEIITS
jgi:hypothetical protein